MIKINKNIDPETEKKLKGKHYYHADICAELEKVHHKKCCYCETANIKGEVEHYRPKSKYPWLSDNWENLLWACHDCNLAKRAQFIPSPPFATAPDNVEICDQKENPLLINPAQDNPEPYLDFDSNGQIIPHNDPHGRMQYTIQTCNLNRENLKMQRIKVLFDLKIHQKAFVRFGDKKQILKFINEIFIQPIKNNPEIGYIAFRKHIIKYWLKDLLNH